MNQVAIQNARLVGEGCESANRFTADNAAVVLLSTFTPFAQIYVLTLLLSLFTHTRIYACAHAHARAGGERGKYRQTAVNGHHGWPTCALSCGTATTIATHRSTRHAATGWPTVACQSGAAKVAPQWAVNRWSLGTSLEAGQAGGRGNSRQSPYSFFRLSELLRCGVTWLGGARHGRERHGMGTRREWFPSGAF